MKSIEKNARNKRQEKKQINIKWDSRLFFQIGLIASLLIVFFVMESTIGMTVTIARNPDPTGLEEPMIINYVIDAPKPEAPKQKVEKPKSNRVQVAKSTAVVGVKNDTPTIEDVVPYFETPIMAPPSLTPPMPKNNQPSTINNVEFVPVFPGCEALGTNKEKIECMSSKINAFITKNFRTELLEDLEKNETPRIYVQFKIDKKGYVTEVVANSRNEKLKNEAQRVVAKLPVMKPGRQGDNNVAVMYTVPIVFNIQ